MRYIRVSALVFGAAGLLVFASAFIASFAVPGFVEAAARQVIRYEVEKQVHEKVAALDNSFLRGQAAKRSAQYAERMADDRRMLEMNLHERTVRVVDEMSNPDCTCRKVLAGLARDGLNDDMTSSKSAQAKLTAFIRTKYMDTANHVTREFRIFTGTNAVVFILLLIAVLMRRGAGAHLLPATVILLISSIITGYTYLFNQDWLHTLLLNDYVGYGYIGYLAAVFALLCDIAFNRARVTCAVVNGVLSALGAALVLVPC